MKTKTPDEQWLEAFLSRHPALHSRMSDRKAAEAVLHDAEVLAPDRLARFQESIVRENVTRLITALQEGDRRTARKILEPLGDDLAMKLLDAIRRTAGRG